MKRIDELVGMPMVTVAEGRRIGKLNGVELDVRDGRIAYLHFDGEGRSRGVVPWSAVRAIGADAVTVESVGSALDTIPHADQPYLTAHVGDRPVVTESGTRLGTITSYDVDEATGQVVQYRLPNGGFLARLTGNEVHFSHGHILSFGRDAIVVRDSVCTAAQEQHAAA